MDYGDIMIPSIPGSLIGSVTNQRAGKLASNSASYDYCNLGNTTRPDTHTYMRIHCANITWKYQCSEQQKDLYFSHHFAHQLSSNNLLLCVPFQSHATFILSIKCFLSLSVSLTVSTLLCVNTACNTAENCLNL